MYLIYVWLYEYILTVTFLNIKGLYCDSVGFCVHSFFQPIAFFHQLVHSIHCELTAVLICSSRGRHRHIAKSVFFFFWNSADLDAYYCYINTWMCVLRVIMCINNLISNKRYLFWTEIWTECLHLSNCCWNSTTYMEYPESPKHTETFVIWILDNFLNTSCIHNCEFTFCILIYSHCEHHKTIFSQNKNPTSLLILSTYFKQIPANH